MRNAIIVGGGLAGSEAAWQLAKRGVHVILYEMRPWKQTGAHKTGLFAELVCSNSLGANKINTPSGLLKEELRQLDSLIIKVADETSVPAGGALAVGREMFARRITEIIDGESNIEIVREEVEKIPKNQVVIIASGPLTTKQLAKEVMELSGNNFMYFYDAIAPIVTFDSIDMDIAFRGARYLQNEKLQGDYINCPFAEEEYYSFVKELITAKRISLKAFEVEINKGVNTNKVNYYEACLPVEVLAKRGKDTLSYGPMRPVGLRNPRTGERPFAVVQLRQDNIANTLYNLVGFQTNLTIPEQKKVFRMIPGLKNAEFIRFGQMHRNLFVNSPAILNRTLSLKRHEEILFAGQITGAEGYVSSIGTGLLAGINAARIIMGKDPIMLPKESMLGALIYYITHASVDNFQPMKANFGILPNIDTTKRVNKTKRRMLKAEKALEAICELKEDFL